MNYHSKNIESTEAQAQTETARALPVEHSEVGASPSNTAPSDDIRGETTVIRVGIDSLYHSYQGKLFEVIEKSLEEFKAVAQSEDPETRALAILNIL